MLYIKYGKSDLNILDVQKGQFTLKEPFKISKGNSLIIELLFLCILLLHLDLTHWIDVNPINSNLLAMAVISFNNQVKIYDKRSSHIVKTFYDTNKGENNLKFYNGFFIKY